MDAWIWVVVIIAIIVAIGLALALVRRARRSGSVLAADTNPRSQS